MKLRKDEFQNLDKKKLAKDAAVGGVRVLGRLFGLAWRLVATILLIAICTGFLFVVLFSFYVKNNLSEEVTVKLSDFNLNQTSTIYYWDEDQQQYAVLEQLSGLSGDSQWVNYEDLNPWFEKAAVAIEDKRFYTHYGVDWYRTFGAFYQTFFSDSGGSFGGSTLTQQLIKNVTQYKDNTVKRKLLEIFRALEFEKTYTKEEIVEWYLNRVFFGENCYGVQAAAQNYFGKDQSELTPAECACIVGITNNPSMYNPYYHPVANKDRQETILDEMYDQGYIDQEADWQTYKAQSLTFQRAQAEDNVTGVDSKATSWFVDAIIEDVIADLMALKDVDRDTAETLLFNAGYTIYATINKDVQDIADQVYASRDNIPAGYRKSATQDLDSAIVVMDPYTGDILALCGGMGEKTISRGFNRATQMLRSPGSTIKPLASYSLCLDEGLVMPWTVFDDSDLHKLQGSDWYPDNDDSQNEGAVTLRYALQVSINTVAAQMIDMLTPQVSFDHLVNNLGFTNLVEDQDGFSDVSYAGMALGQLTHGESVREMCQAYTVLCNEGIYTSGRTYSRIEDASGALVYENIPESHVALKETTAYYMTEMLTNAVNRGTGWLSKFGAMGIAGKSGGSSDWKDRWYVAYTPYLLAAVWTGYETPENMGSSNPATGLWKQVMEPAHAALGYADKPFDTPEDMKKVTICVDTGLLASEACEHEIRGDRTMTLYMKPEEIPTSICEAHVYRDLCKDSHGLISENCPEESRTQLSVLDPSRYDGTLTTPLYFENGQYPKRVDYYDYVNKYKDLYENNFEAWQAIYDADQAKLDEKVATATPYVLTEMGVCRVHRLDPVSGWRVEYPHGYLINPLTGMYYDIENDILIDQYSMKQVDWLTGYLIDPETGGFIDPRSGNPVTLTPEELLAYLKPKYQRPPGYPLLDPQTPPLDPDTPEPGTEPDPTDPGQEDPDTPPLEVTPTPSAEPASPPDLWFNRNHR